MYLAGEFLTLRLIGADACRPGPGTCCFAYYRTASPPISNSVNRSPTWTGDSEPSGLNQEPS